MLLDEYLFWGGFFSLKGRNVSKMNRRSETLATGCSYDDTISLRFS